MSRNSKGRTVLLAGCVFAVGWIAGATYDRLPLPSFLGSAVAQTERTPLEYNLLALMLGVASVAVDTEAAALRINELTDRLAAVERRVQQLGSARLIPSPASRGKVPEGRMGVPLNPDAATKWGTAGAAP